ncbi:TetR/AcrR family transcriptional regulator [Gryllotalpicola protaetiae]|uniref:TetR/AcrR family transcriptional regulator n=1 Tax=Gryllotalpicola protaetiae TaxID=2419771 RepID=UPI001FEBCF8F|nr:TetR family transcriptional regulator [Gryllotalpicola protaetiae]
MGQISQRVGVSTRTFNRYFATKDEVVLAHEDQVMDELVAALEARPPGESPLTALRGIFRDLLDDSRWNDARLRRFWRAEALIRDSPELMGANFARWEGRKERLARLFAARSGQVVGFEWRLLASVAFTAIGIALSEWAGLPAPDRVACARLIDAALGRVARGLDHTRP